MQQSPPTTKPIDLKMQQQKHILDAKKQIKFNVKLNRYTGGETNKEDPPLLSLYSRGRQEDSD